VFAVDLGEGAELRPLEPWQAAEFLAHMDRARASIDPWIPWASRSADRESATGTLQRYADLQAKDAGRSYGIWLDGTLVGGTLFVSFSTETGVAEVGCWLEPAATGRGLITRAIRVLIDWAFRTRGLHRIEWHCRTDNIPSSNVARRLGMHLDGTMRSSSPWQGTRHDIEIWSILSPEWPPEPSGPAV
jgi:RimJ/RimL family protein N-acetyltransferase